MTKTTIQVEKETRERLGMVKSTWRFRTYDDVIQRLIDFYAESEAK